MVLKLKRIEETFSVTSLYFTLLNQLHFLNRPKVR